MAMILKTKTGYELVKGEYCGTCVRAFTESALRQYSLLPMCRECMQNFLDNGDFEKMCDVVIFHEQEHQAVMWHLRQILFDKMREVPHP